MSLEAPCDLRGKYIPVDGQSAASWNLRLIGGLHDDRAAAAHLFMQQTDGIALPIVGAEGIGAHQFSQTVRVVGVGLADGPHFVEHHRAARLGNLPGGLASGQSAADNVDGIDLAAH